MKLKELTVSRGATVNLGDYESARVDFSVTYQLDESEVDLQILRDVDVDVRELIVDEVNRIKGSARGKSPRRFVEGV